MFATPQRRRLRVDMAMLVAAVGSSLCCLASAQDDLEFPGKAMRDAMLSAAKRAADTAASNPNSVSPYLQMAEWYTGLWCYGFAERDQSLDKARQAAQEAVRLAADSAEAHTALGVCHFADWKWDSAKYELELAICLDPNNDRSRHWYALFLAAMGDKERSIFQSQEAVRLNRTVGNRVGLGAVRYFARDFVWMEKEMKDLTAEQPTNGVVHDWLGMALIEQGKMQSSVSTYQKASKLSGGLAEIEAGLAHALAISGRADEANQVLARLKTMSTKWHIPPVQIAFVHAGLGQTSEALDWLERAQREKSWELVFLRVEPWLDGLREEPRFKDIQAAMLFPEARISPEGG